MKIFTHVLLTLCMLLSITSNMVHSADHNAVTHALGNLSNQLEKLHYLATPFPSLINLPQEITILDDKINNQAPSQDNLKQFAHATGIEIVQLIVAYQDLSLATFCQKTDDVEAQLAHLLALESGDSSSKIMGALLLDKSNKEYESNKKLQAQLKARKIATNLGYSIGGGSASCGYHTLAHLQTLHQFFNGEGNLNHLINLTYINKLFGLTVINNTLNLVLTPKIPSPGTWRNNIINEQKTRYTNAKTSFFKKNPALTTQDFETWLKDDANEKTKIAFLRSFSSVSTKDGEWLTDSGMAHLENNKETNPKEIRFSLWYADIATSESELKSIQEIINKPAYNLPITVNAHNSHWYGVYLQKKSAEGNILCVIMDSKNVARYNTQLTIEMLTTLFPEKTVVINDNRSFLRATESATTNPAIERIALLRVLAVSEDASLLQQTLPQSLSPAELLFIFNEFAYFELARDIIKNYKIFIAAYNQLNNGTINTITDFTTWLAKNLPLDPVDHVLNETVAQVIFPVFGRD